MTIRRRDFLKKVGTAVAAMAALPPGLRGEPVPGVVWLARFSDDPFRAVARLRRASFAPLLGAAFQVAGPKGVVSLTLAEIRDQAPLAAPPRRGPGRGRVLLPFLLGSAGPALNAGHLHARAPQPRRLRAVPHTRRPRGRPL